MSQCSFWTLISGKISPGNLPVQSAGLSSTKLLSILVKGNWGERQKEMSPTLHTVSLGVKSELLLYVASSAHRKSGYP